MKTLSDWCVDNNRQYLLEEWDYEKNGIITPATIGCTSKSKIWWICPRNHSYDASIGSRTKQNSGCPYCSNNKLLKGFNDLATLKPDLVKEWNHEKNKDLIPSDVLSGSTKKVWWICKYGHEWQDSIDHRTSRNYGCPYCSGHQVLSGYNDLLSLYPDVAKEWNYEKNSPLEPSEVTSKSGKKVWWRCERGHEWEASIGSRSNGCGCPYCVNKKVLAGFNDLATINPELAEEWNYEKNENLKPSDVLFGTSQKVWWKGKCGHEWYMSVVSRTGEKHAKCPICSSKRLLIGFNDLETKYPEIAAQWDYESNYPILPSDVMPNTAKKYWWKCDKGHVWDATPNSRTHMNSGCPYCSHQKLLKGYNDLATSYPNVLIEWDYDKNTIEPDEIMAHTMKKVWWKCKSGHEYLMSTASKTSGSGCPICAMATHTSFPEQAIYFYINKAYPDAINAYRKYVVELDVFIPSIKTAIEYDGYRAHKHKYKKDIEKNKLCADNGIKLIRLREDMLPNFDDGLSTVILLKQSNMTALENALVELFDILGVSMDIDLERDEISIKELYDNFKKERSIADVAPELVKEWHPIRNGNITPDNVYANSNHKYWWKCSKGHEWKSSAEKRVSAHRGCPYCANQRVLKGYNDLASQFPEVVKMWSPNNKVSPDEVIARSNKKYLWIGDCGHEWEAALPNLRKGCGCPYCANQKVLRGFNDLQTLKPEFVNEWNYEKNNPLLPTDIVAGSGAKVWWKCSKCGIEWKAAPVTRKQLNCRSCNQKEAGLKRRKRVVNIDTGEIYESVNDVESKTGISVQCVGLCCRGKLKTAGGYHWKYIE